MLGTYVLPKLLICDEACQLNLSFLVRSGKVHVSTHLSTVFFAQRHIPRSGAMMLFPSSVREYSTATAFDAVFLLSPNPLHSTLPSLLLTIPSEPPSPKD